MATTDVSLHAESRPPEQKPVVNDFSIQVATVNGSGSQTRQHRLAAQHFPDGHSGFRQEPVPLEHRRAAHLVHHPRQQDGYIARKKDIDFMVAMNPETAQEDVLSLRRAPPVSTTSRLNLSESARRRGFLRRALRQVRRPRLPRGQAAQAGQEHDLRRASWRNCWASTWPRSRRRCASSSRKKAKAAELNWSAAQAGFEFAAATLTKHDPPSSSAWTRPRARSSSTATPPPRWAHVRRRHRGHLVSHHAVVLARETLIDYMKRFPHRPDGKATFAIVQAEDELAAIGMVLGAGWAGARSMTATAGPGISLMAEFAGFGYYAEIPGVIFDVQRVGPSTGLPTRTAQGDSFDRPPFARRHQASHAAALFGGGMFHHGERSLRSGRAFADARSS